MNLDQLRIGYWPNNPSLAVPGDRRRFVFYARKRNLNFEIASPDKEYDIVFLTYGCNISDWLKYKRKFPKAKIIFELIDSYLLENPNLFGFVRGTVRYMSRKESKLHLNYRSAIRRMVREADAVVCSTPIQREFMLRWNNNIHISLDSFEQDILFPKKDYSVSGKLKLVWEGQAYTVSNLLSINKVLEQLADQIELHVISDPVAMFPLKFFNKETKHILRKLKCNWEFHQWEKENFAQLIASSDLAIIPIDRKDKLMWNKPENKLLLLWESGIPVLTTDTPAYKRVMEGAGINMCCETLSDWSKQILTFKKSDKEQRAGIISKAKNYLAANHSQEILVKKWDAIFESVIH